MAQANYHTLRNVGVDVTFRETSLRNPRIVLRGDPSCDVHSVSRVLFDLSDLPIRITVDWDKQNAVLPVQIDS